jgi:hypothetical protein
MRMSDLLHTEVFDSEWKPIGRVQDVRLVQDGPLLGLSGAAFRVDGFVVGKTGLGVRLGFHRANVKGPWALKAFFGRLENRARFVRWDEVAAWEERGLHLRRRFDELPGMPEG